MGIDDLRTRFFSKIKPCPTSSCIIWIAAARPAGYGLLSVDGVLRCATHVSWFLKHGHWPEFLRHTCDNPPCVNPEHLIPGSDKSNAEDREARGRGVRQESALTGLELSEMVELTKTRMSLDEIGDLFGVSGAYVSTLTRPRRERKPKAGREITVDGVTRSIAEWCVEIGVSDSTFRSRLEKGLVGSDLIAPAHRAPRKDYTRRV